MARDAVEVAPNVYKVLFENDRVRLLEARVKPGDSSAMHSHPDYLVYTLGGGTVTFTSGSESVDVELTTGQAMWREAEEHAAKNPGTGDLVALLFELKR
jgi:quercetin dioxygenase-like cupin family protein